MSRNRIATPNASPLGKAFGILVLEPGSLMMERKMLLGIKRRAEMPVVRGGDEGPDSEHPSTPGTPTDVGT